MLLYTRFEDYNVYTRTKRSNAKILNDLLNPDNKQREQTQKQTNGMDNNTFLADVIKLKH